MYLCPIFCDITYEVNLMKALNNILDYLQNMLLQ